MPSCKRKREDITEIHQVISDKEAADNKATGSSDIKKDSLSVSKTPDLEKSITMGRFLDVLNIGMKECDDKDDVMKALKAATADDSITALVNSTASLSLGKTMENIDAISSYKKHSYMPHFL